MSKKNNISDEELRVFRQAVRNVKKMSDTKVSPPRAQAPLPQKSRVNRSESEEPSLSSFSDHENLPDVGSDDLISYQRSGIQHKMLRKLRNGQYNVEAVLDLHGKSVEEARESLQRFLLRCSQQEIRHVLIVHGKGHSNGRPVLKNKLNHWLRQTDQVLAFCSATARDGRSGALYVLLKMK